MRKRKRKLLGVAGLALLTAAAVYVAWPRPDHITRENCARIREGMSRAEVEAILGPAGDYTTAPVTLSIGYRVLGDVDGDGKLIFLSATEWRGDTGSIWINFNRDGIVGVTEFSPQERENQGTLENLWWRAERQRRKWFPEE